MVRQNAQSYNFNAIAWGPLGREMFSPGKTYYIVPFALVIGLVLPIPGCVLHRMYPENKIFANVNTGIIVQYSSDLSIGINTSVNTAMALSVLSQWWFRQRHPRWFTKCKCRRYSFRTIPH